MSRKITPEIYHLENSICLVKVTSNDGCQDFCCTESREFANLIRDKLASHLITEMKADSNYSATNTQICQDNINESIVISTIALGYLYNGAKIPVYTISVSTIPYGMVHLLPREEKAKSIVVEESVPQYATFETVPVAIPKHAVIETMPIEAVITPTVPLPPPPPKIRLTSPINKSSNSNRRFNLERVIDELKINLQRIRIDNQL